MLTFRSWFRSWVEALEELLSEFDELDDSVFVVVVVVCPGGTSTAPVVNVFSVTLTVLLPVVELEDEELVFVITPLFVTSSPVPLKEPNAEFLLNFPLKNPRNA